VVVTRECDWQLIGVVSCFTFSFFKSNIALGFVKFSLPAFGHCLNEGTALSTKTF